MWAKLNSDKDTIEEIIVNPKTMTVDGITHPVDRCRKKSYWYSTSNNKWCIS